MSNGTESVYPECGAGILVQAAGINYAIPNSQSLAIIN